MRLICSFVTTVGLAMILDSMRNEEPVLGKSNSNAYNHMIKLLQRRTFLQSQLRRYIEARTALKSCERGKLFFHMFWITIVAC